MIKRIHRIDRINTNYIANHQRILLKFGDLRCFYSVICGIFIRWIVTISFGESRKGISPIIVYSFKRNNPIPVIVHWAHILSVAIIAQKILFLPRKTAKNDAEPSEQTNSAEREQTPPCHTRAGCRVHQHSPCYHLLSTANITKGHRYLVSPWDMDTSLGGYWNGKYNGFYGQNNKNSLFPLWHT